MKDIIQSKNGLNVLISHKGIIEDSRIFCDKIEYIHDKGTFEIKGLISKCKIFDHHLMFWLNNKLIFKVWLPNEIKDKKFKNINDALKSCGIRVFRG